MDMEEGTEFDENALNYGMTMEFFIYFCLEIRSLGSEVMKS